MIAWWWSWILAGFGVTGLWLAGVRGKPSGWVIGMASQLLWSAYAIVTRQFGFLVTVAAYGTVYSWCLWAALEPVRELRSGFDLSWRAASRMHRARESVGGSL